MRKLVPGSHLTLYAEHLMPTNYKAAEATDKSKEKINRPFFSDF
jgi:hypothetical protein